MPIRPGEDGEERLRHMGVGPLGHKVQTPIRDPCLLPFAALPHLSLPSRVPSSSSSMQLYARSSPSKRIGPCRGRCWRWRQARRAALSLRWRILAPLQRRRFDELSVSASAQNHEGGPIRDGVQVIGKGEFQTAAYASQGEKDDAKLALNILSGNQEN